MNRYAIGTVFGALMLLATPQAFSLTKDEYKAEKDKIEADYKSAKDKCKDMKGNEKDVCQAEAKATEKKAKAKLEADYKNTPRAQRHMVEENAEADYMVAKARCGAKSGNDKDVCVKEAKAAEKSAKAEAKKTSEDKAEAKGDAKDAQYKADKEKCDAMSGAAKDKCQADVKARYGK